MIDLNEAEIQKEGGAPVPEGSIVPLRMSIRPPRSGKEGNTHALFCKAKSGNEYIDVEFEVLGTFEGNKIWQNFTLVGSDQAAKISMRTLRAILESSRGIKPSDASPQATEARKLTDWADFNGMTFLAKVGCKVEQNPKDGRWYCNNEIKKVITADDGDEYTGGEKITDAPLPKLPEQGQAPAPAAAKSAGPAWGAQPSAVPAAAPPPSANPMPAWAMK